MSQKSIVFFDSGVGGLPYLKRAKQYMAGENFIYVADVENFPYGEKSANELRKIIHELTKNIIKKINPKLIVIACNTASVVALSTLREEFGIPFVGVVPAIKPAGENKPEGSIGLLATRKTIEEPYTDNLIDQFAAGSRVEKYAGIDLVDFVENRFLDAPEEERLNIVADASNYFSNKNISTIVLGCTHFVYLKNYFEEYFDQSVKIIDSVEGVCQQIKRLIDFENPELNISLKDRFFVTSNKIDEPKYLKFAEQFNLTWSGLL
jgi:glutamate racemase